MSVKKINVIFILFFISFFVSMSAMDFFSTLLLMALIVLKLKNSDLMPKMPKKINVIFCSLFLAWTTSILLSFTSNNLSFVVGFKKWLEIKWILHAYLFLFIFTLTPPNKKFFEFFGYTLGFCSLYAVVCALLKFDIARWTPIEAFGNSGLARAGGFFGNEMVYAHVYGIIFCIYLSYIFFCISKDLKHKAKELLIVFVSFFSILLTQTRGLIGALLLSIPLIGLFKNFKSFLMLIAFLCGFSALVYFSSSAAQSRISNTLSEKSYDGERVWIWKANWKMISESPWLGKGYGENQTLLPDYYIKISAPPGLLVSHAHNQFLHILAGMGIVGLITYLGTLLFFIFLNFKLIKSSIDTLQKSLLVGSFAAQSVFLLGGLFEANFEHSKVKYAIALTWALVLYFYLKYLNSTEVASEKN